MMSRKEVNHRYYEKKVKPFRKNKGVAEQMKMRCFMCGHFIDYKKYMEKEPSIIIDVKLWEFGGRANIIVKDFAEIKPEFKEFVRNVLISKLKLMLRALNEGIDTFQGLVEMPLAVRFYETNINSNVETKINNPVEVKYGY